MDDDAYAGREQSAAKHLVLSTYLELLALKIGFFRSGITINYIDGFAGPWESKSGDLSDTSPAIALTKLLEASRQVAKLSSPMTVRAFFFSLTNEGVAQLEALRLQFPEIALEVVKGSFLDSVESACLFATGGRDPFAFFFIDPMGWTGLDMQLIAPLLRSGPNEVLINFMTGHISRFIDSGDVRYEETFADLFGGAGYRDEWRGLEGLDREDAIVDSYCRRVAEAGKYKYVVASVILNPRKDRTHYHLIYGTRSDAGLVTFREVEHKSMEFQRSKRGLLHQRSRIAESNQEEMFKGADTFCTYEDELQIRYRERVRKKLDALLRENDEVPWDQLIRVALQTPMTCEADVKEWLKEQKRKGALEVLGLADEDRVPKRGRNHRVRRVRRLF